MILYTLKEAAKILGGDLTDRSLRTEIKRGRLVARRIGSKLLVTMDDIRDMIEQCAVAKPKAPASISDAASGNLSSSTTDENGSLNAAKATAKALKRPSRNISKANIERQQGQVIPIK